MSVKIKIIIAGLAVVALVTAGFYFGYQKYYLSPVPSNTGLTIDQSPPRENGSKSEAIKLPPSEIKTLAPKTETLLPGFKLYKNSDFGFEIQYPEFWIVSAENIVNVRGENTKGFFFKKPGSDLRFAVLPKDGLSYSLPNNGISEDINISGFPGVQTKYITADGRRLLLVHPQIDMFNWDQEIGRLDIGSSALDPVGDFVILNKMLNSFKFVK